MYLETTERLQGEVQQTLKLSQAIRLGAAMGVREERSWNGCAIATALKAVGAWERGNFLDVAHLVFKVPINRLVSVSAQHSMFGDRLKIADQLEAEGY